MNRILYREQTDLVHLKTLSDFIERKGSELEKLRNDFTEETLEEHGFNLETALPVVDLPSKITYPKTSVLPETKVQQTLEHRSNVSISPRYHPAWLVSFGKEMLRISKFCSAGEEILRSGGKSK